MTDLAWYRFTIRFVKVTGAYINPDAVGISEPVELDPARVRRIDMVSDVSGTEYIRLIELFPEEEL